jgi:hypothetical protein
MLKTFLVFLVFSLTILSQNSLGAAVSKDLGKQTCVNEMSRCIGTRETEYCIDQFYHCLCAFNQYNQSTCSECAELTMNGANGDFAGCCVDRP